MSRGPAASGESSPSSLRVSVSGTPPEDWDRFVAGSEDATFCHLAGWGPVLQRSLGVRPLFLAASRGEMLEGVLPLYRMPRLGPGHVLVSVPYLNYGGPLGRPEARSLLVSRALELAEESGARRLEIRARAPVETTLEAGRDKITVVLELPDDPAHLFEKGFKAKLRSQIRRPMKEGMEARFGPGEAEPFHRVFARNMRDLGTPVLPLRLFRAIRDTFPDHAEFGAVYHEGRPVAAGCGFRFGAEFEMTWASSLRELGSLAPNMLLYWSFMERCIEHGISRFNFGRCTPGGGTHRFKSQWGGIDEPLPWIQWPEGSAGESPESGVFKLATRVWQRLPLPLANRMGPLLARRIPTF